ncbi:M16 family metallopeptidase [Candidatus Latescibacterota bacterium]
MNRKRVTIVTIMVYALLAVSFTAAGQSAQSKFTYELDEILPLDSNVTVGKLDNGLTYYIRENPKPEKRMELRLVVKAGSVAEDDDQQGLAHFIEHMAFNGTKNFEKQALVNFLESIGMRFGSDINASTSFDEIIYQLQVPTDSVHIMETAFQVIEDWAHNISFDEDEIDKERGVIIEEWRSRRGAQARMIDKQLPILFTGSKYADRLPIGKVEAIEGFDVKTFKDYYSDWYRPDLMAVVAVGDFDGGWIEQQIKEYFSRLKTPSNAKERIAYPMPDHEETLFAIATDPEASSNSVSIYFKHDTRQNTTVADYRRYFVERLYNSMLNQRMIELTRQSEPPFLYGYSAKGRIVRSKDVYMLGTAVLDNGIEKGLETLMTEAARVQRHGFTDTELERQKQEFLRMVEQYYNERDKTESASYTGEYVQHFLSGMPSPGIAYEFETAKRYAPGIRLDDVNRLAGEWITDNNRVIMISASEKEDVNVPGEKEILAIVNAVSQKDIEPYVDGVSDSPLVGMSPKPSKVDSETTIDEIGVTEWKLDNGVRVILKPTDFKNDEILFTATSPGGHSLVPDEVFTAGRTASSVVREGGVSVFSLIELEKKLSGKVVSVSPWIGSTSEGFSGNASPDDIETLFQLVYLYVTSPRRDETAFNSFKSRMKGFIENRSARPETAYSDTISVTMSQYHYRARPWNLDILDEMDLEESFRIYRDRLGDAGDFTFIFVGNFDLVSIRPLVETWLGGLPSSGRDESWKDTGMRYPKGQQSKEVNAGIEPKSNVNLMFTGDFTWTYRNRYELTSMIDVLRIKLRETIREDMGGTYGVGVSQSLSHYPVEDYRISVAFGCAPDRVEELTTAVMTQIDSLRTHGTTDTYLAKIKESHRRKREVDLKENNFWLNVLDFYYTHGENPLTLLEFDERVESLSLETIREAAHKYLDTSNMVKVVLYPEKK